ncbi:hypothetical protein TrST_g4371 [Triparma strigata]|uniref:Uncharacterized protein n=1 Tax=Triparma strigata TaxID=1606541 RepID=A0A9W7E505_9STRA|nr:hypothetical protein TrST_g4371 [Triparma strigata]
MPSSSTIQVAPNTRNLVLNGPTIRASSLAQSLQRPVPEVDNEEPLFQFSPEEPNFGMLSSNCVYHLNVMLRTNGADVARFRLKPPQMLDKDGNAVGEVEEGAITLAVKVSSTRLIPGLHEQLTLEVRTTKEGRFKFDFVIVGELQTYKLTVNGHVLPPEGFHALAALAKLEGRSGLSPGVRFFSDLTTSLHPVQPPPAPSSSSSPSPPQTSKTTSDTERDTIIGLYPNSLDLEDVGSFPTLTGVYWDKNLNTMSLHVPSTSHIVIDGSKSLEEVIEENDKAVNEMQMKPEMKGHLTTRCLESLREDGRVPREMFRTLSNCLNN